MLGGRGGVGCQGGQGQMSGEGHSVWRGERGTYIWVQSQDGWLGGSPCLTKSCPPLKSGNIAPCNFQNTPRCENCHCPLSQVWKLRQSREAKLGSFTCLDQAHSGQSASRPGLSPGGRWDGGPLGHHLLQLGFGHSLLSYRQPTDICTQFGGWALGLQEERAVQVEDLAVGSDSKEHLLLVLLHLGWSRMGPSPPPWNLPPLSTATGLAPSP